MKEEENSLQLLLLNSGLFASKPVSYWTCAVSPAGGGGAEGSCLEILEQCLVDKVFSEEESRSVDVWQPLLLKVNFIT